MTAPKENKKQPPANADRPPPPQVQPWGIHGGGKLVIPPYIYDKDFVEFFKKVPPK